MGSDTFDISVADSQATVVRRVSPRAFDLSAYEAYEERLRERCRTFWSSDSGILVYRRMRVAEVFSAGCRDMRNSLELQLGALHKSMEYEADVPNFLEPWYGIGTIAAAFGLNYEWKEDVAPMMRPAFQSAAEALDSPVTPVSDTEVGRHILEMIDFFLEETGGRLPMSLTDVQSPFNTACNLIPVDSFFIEMIMEPDAVRALLRKIVGLQQDFTKQQVARIGSALASPGHGFASARDFCGMGMSDDNMLMISPETYLDCAAESLVKVAEPFGGPCFHSCGNWSGRVDSIKQYKGLRVVDGAFSAATDPCPNCPDSFSEAFAGTGIVVNARIVGTPDVVEDVVKHLWRSGMRLIVVTYCQTPEEQREAYKRVHEVCKN